MMMELLLITVTTTRAYVGSLEEALASLRYTCLVSFFLDPEDIRVLGVGAVCSFAKGTGLL
jgi:hypothetical protein